MSARTQMGKRRAWNRHGIAREKIIILPHQMHICSSVPLPKDIVRAPQKDEMRLHPQVLYVNQNYGCTVVLQRELPQEEKFFG